MRTIQLLYLVLFLIFYGIISYGTIKSLSGIIISTLRKKVQWLVIIISSIIFFSFILLYIWPLTPENIKEYSFHLIFNAILSIDFIFKITLALSALGSVFFSHKLKPVIYYIGLILAIGASSSVIYGSLFGTKELVINNIELEFENLPKNYDGCKILQISDIHLGNFLNSKKLMFKVQRETQKTDPDFIVFTGDLVNNFASELNGWNDIFLEIIKNTNSYSILGNHDYGDYTNWEFAANKTDNFKQIISAHNKFGLRLLNNEHIKIKSGSDSIYIVGVQNWGHPPFPQYADLGKAMDGVPENSFKILLTHDPAHWDEIVKHSEEFALTLSGHTHGLQWGIKKAGITFSFSSLTRKHWGGLYRYGKSQLYVNTGLGTVGLPWRINMPAEITVLTLKRIEIDRK